MHRILPDCDTSEGRALRSFVQRQPGALPMAGLEMIGAARDALRKQRGAVASVIFQEPMTSLNPLQTVELQIAETLKVHRGLDRKRARVRVLELLRDLSRS